MRKKIFILLIYCISQISYSESINKTYDILYINSYHSGFSWSDNIEIGFKSEMENLGLNCNIYFERLDSKRIPIEKMEIEYHHLLKAKYHMNHFDAVVTSDDNAFNFAIKYREDLFPNVPIIFSGVNDRGNPYLLNESNIAGVLEDVDITGLLELILIVHPNVKHIAVVGDQTPSATIHINNTIEVLETDYKQLDYSIHKEWTLHSLKNELVKLPKATIIIELAFHLDKNSETISFEQERNFLKNEINIPAYSLWDNRLNYGIVGGVIASGNVHGQVAARLTTSIINGNFPVNPILDNITFPTYFDYEMLKRFGISLKNIPKKAIIINEPDTLWSKYKRYIIMIIIFSIAQIVLIVFLIVNINYRRIAKRKLLLLNKELENKVDIRTKELKESLTNLQLTQENLIETEKMASLGSLVRGISHKINTPIGICKTISSYMKEQLEDDPSEDIKKSIYLLESNIDKVASMINDFRQISIDFTSESITSINVFEFISQILLSQQSRFESQNIKTNFSCPERLIITTYPGVLLKVLIILIKNSIVHGFEGGLDDPQIFVEIINDTDYITIKYSDNGRGIDPHNYKKIFDPFYTTSMGKGNSGLGLNIAYNEIVHRLKGKITADNSNKKGLGFIISFPNKN